MRSCKIHKNCYIEIVWVVIYLWSSTYIRVATIVVLLAACSAWWEVGKTISSTDWLKYTWVAHAVMVTGGEKDVIIAKCHGTTYTMSCEWSNMYVPLKQCCIQQNEWYLFPTTVWIPAMLTSGQLNRNPSVAGTAKKDTTHGMKATLFPLDLVI